MSYRKIILHGGQTCDYLHIQQGETDIDNYQYVNAEPKSWGSSTVFSAKFDGNLKAGNTDLLETLTGYTIRKRCGSDSHTSYVGTIPSKNPDGSPAKKYMIDYLIKNQTDYTYYLYPNIGDSTEDGVVLSPFVSKNVSTDWDGWSLLLVDESIEENVYYINKIFKFDLNVTVDDMNNNAIVNITPNFTKYPTIQYGTSNYWSGKLTALCGFISANDTEYIQTPNMIAELKDLVTDTRRKFLKDMDGNIFEVKITAPITIGTLNETIDRVKSVEISWTEVGKIDKVSIISNPSKPTVSWLLTEDGTPISYVDYIWDEHYKWDDSYRWTSNEHILANATSNQGRNIQSQEGGDE